MWLSGYSIYLGTYAALHDAVKKRGSSGRFLKILTINAEIAVRAEQLDWADRLKAYDWVLADGVSIKNVFEKQYKRKVPRLTGVDFLDYVFFKGALTCYVLGAEQRTLDALKKVLANRYPKAKIVGMHHGYWENREWAAIQDEICILRPDLVVVATGFPKQDEVLATLSTVLDHGCGIGVGGALDVIAGVQKRAPLLLQKTGFEWLYRLLKQPSRWPRLGYLITFVWWTWFRD